MTTKNAYSTVHIVAALHGDELYGFSLYDAFCAKHPKLKNYIHISTGNKAALAAKTRFVDIDMNRAYLQNDSSLQETKEIKRLNAGISEAAAKYVLDIHTTKRNSGTFLISNAFNDCASKVAPFFGGISVATLSNDIVKTSLIGRYTNAISLEVSLVDINNSTTSMLVSALRNLIEGNTNSKTSYKTYKVKDLISESDYNNNPGLKNYTKTAKGVAIMVPADVSEMSATYYGFWGQQTDTSKR